jgi:acetylornithine deacetylase/succinyl-diaminopimelate desuccinylase-like protein
MDRRDLRRTHRGAHPQAGRIRHAQLAVRSASPRRAASAPRAAGSRPSWNSAAANPGGRLQVAFDEHLVEQGPRIPQPTQIVNVVATLPGRQAESRDRHYVVSGHYDSMPSSPWIPRKDAPGANDDASGTAVSMELACVMARYEFDATLVFMAVAGEEQGLLGSTGLGEGRRRRRGSTSRECSPTTSSAIHAAPMARWTGAGCGCSPKACRPSRRFPTKSSPR